MAITNSTIAQAVNDLIEYWDALNQEYAAWLSGVVNGGPGNDGKYPLTDYLGNVTMTYCPAQLEENVESVVTGAQGYSDAADASATAAAASAAAAATSASDADADRIAALAAQSAAESAQSAAESARTTAIAQAGVATTKASEASASAAAALVSEGAAQDAQSYAEEWAIKAEDSLVSVAAGGDGVTEYSSFHWAKKAEADAAAAATFNPALYAALADDESVTGAWTFEDVLTLGAAGAAVTLDPAATHANITLSNGNLTATRAAGTAWVGTFATAGKATGKWYWEVLIGTSTVTWHMVGLAPSSLGTSAYAGSTADSYGLHNSSPPVYYNNATTSASGISAFGNGDVIMVAYDADNGKLWFGKNGTWDGDPAAGTGAAFTGLTGTNFPTQSMYSTGSVTMRFTPASFGYTVPSGFTGIGAGGQGTVTWADGEWTLSGNFAASNLNVSNWDTAYGWGDHSLAGYLTAVEGTDVDATGVTDGYVLTADGAGNSAWEAVPAGLSASADETITGDWTFSGDVSGTANPLTLSGATPGFAIYETDGGVNEKYWKMYAAAGAFSFRLADDSGSSDGSILSVTRSAATQVSSIVFGETDTESLFTGYVGARYGLHGDYLAVGGGTDYGGTIWALDSSYTGASGGADSSDTGLYGIKWKRSNHTTATVGEGLYGHVNGTFYWGLGTSGLLLPASGQIGFGAFSTTYIQEGTDNQIRLGTDHGYIDIGPQNATYSHYSTNTSSGFYTASNHNFNGTVRRYNKGSFFSNNSASYLSGTVTYSTGAASGGSSGDIWFQYT